MKDYSKMRILGAGKMIGDCAGENGFKRDASLSRIKTSDATTA